MSTCPRGRGVQSCGWSTVIFSGGAFLVAHLAHALPSAAAWEQQSVFAFLAAQASHALPSAAAWEQQSVFAFLAAQASHALPSAAAWEQQSVFAFLAAQASHALPSAAAWEQQSVFSFLAAQALPSALVCAQQPALVPVVAQPAMEKAARQIMIQRMSSLL
jgi:hypothetical protein